MEFCLGALGVWGLTRENTSHPCLGALGARPGRQEVASARAGRCYPCYSWAMNYTELDSYVIRAAAHARADAALRFAQRFQKGVTDLDASHVMKALESGAQPSRSSIGRWSLDVGGGIGWKVSTVVNEMIRTGLVRHIVYREGPSGLVSDVLIPALVHYNIRDTVTGLSRSACLFVGEDLGPMRARLVDDLALVDCLQCESVIATGNVRKL
jgi:hypothetical protein